MSESNSSNYERVEENANVNRTTIHLTDRAMSVIALVLAALAIGVLLVMPAYIDAKVQAGIAKAEELAHNADTNSRVGIEHYSLMEQQLAVLKDRAERKEK